MAAVILPFALATGRQVRGPAQHDPAPRNQGWMTLDLDGTMSPLRGPLPAAAGRFALGTPPRRVPAEAILAIGRRIRRAANLPGARAPQASAPQAPSPSPASSASQVALAPQASPPGPARPRMPRKHKLMLVTAAAVLYTGGMEARRHFKPRAVLIEVPSTRANAIAALPLPLPRTAA